MTLSPIFRSNKAVEVLVNEGVWTNLLPAAQGQAHAIDAVKRDLSNVLASQFVDSENAENNALATGTASVEFVQEFFFLIMFRSVLETIGLARTHLDFCSEINFCIKGTITAADNIFDDQNKSLLPLRTGDGARFGSILQLMAFERLSARVIERAVRGEVISHRNAQRLQQELLSAMAVIGTLEGSEEGGVDAVLDPQAMIERVHRVRGGALFELAFIAPRLLGAVDASLISRAQAAVSKLGTAFQIVDDVTDFEADLVRGSHNLLVSQITHCGSPEERRHLREMDLTTGADGDVVSDLFQESARKVIALGEGQASQALRELQAVGFWFPPELSADLVRAITGLDGVERMRSLDQ